MPPQAQQSQAAGSQDFTGKADQHVPTFSNVQSEYKEFRRRCDIYAAKMKIAKRSNETVYNIMTLLTGRAWDCVEDLQVSDLAKENAYDVVMDRLDKAFKYEALTELPQDFENFFINMQRKAGQTVQDFETEYLHVERKLINIHKIDIPEKIRAWWFLRRSGLTREQRQLVLTQLGEGNLTLDRAMKAVNFIIGQDSKLDGGRQPRHHQHGSYKAVSYAADEQGGDDDDDVWWNEEEDEQDQVDWSEDYYDQTYAANDDPDHDDAFDVQEYDDVFASYVEAKSQLNRMRTSRGYYPVVAMVRGPVVGGGDRKPPSKGKKGRGKSKGKHGGGKSRSSPPQKGSAKNRAQDALGRQVCLRCGGSGHWARNCPVQPGQGEKKRKVDDELSDIKMVAEMVTEDYMVDVEEKELVAADDLAIQDSGAASVLGSLTYIRKYVNYLKACGIDVENEVEVFECNKGFRYGNSQKEKTNRCCLLPIYVGGCKRQILCYVIGGETRILIGRPLMKQLGMVVDFENDLVMYSGGKWHDIELGPKGEHTIRLAADLETLKSSEVKETLMPDDFASHIDVCNKIPLQDLIGDDINAVKEEVKVESSPGMSPMSDNLNDNVTPEFDERTPSPEAATEVGHDSPGTVPTSLADSRGSGGHDLLQERISPAGLTSQSGDLSMRALVSQSATTSNSTRIYDKGSNMSPLQPAKLRKMIYEAQGLVKEHDSLIYSAQDPPQKQHVVWEIYAGRGRVSEEVNKFHYCKAVRFGLKDGWDFSRPADRRRFLAKLKEEEQPDDVMLSPMCKLWSPLQALTASRSLEARRFLVDARAHDHETHLTFVAVVYMAQYRAGRHATIEHPWNSRAWMTKALSRLPGFVTRIDECMLGLELQDDDGVVKPVKKPTCLKTTRKNLHTYMGVYVCDGSHAHTPCEGYIAGQGRRSKLAEDYPIEMARELALCLIGREETADEINAAEEADEEIERDREPQADDGDEQQQEDQRQEKETIQANRQLRREVGSRAVDYVARLHKNLGHPSPAVLVKMLGEVQASGDVMKAAEKYLCRQCYGRAKPSQVPPAAGISSTTFNNRLVCDSSWIQLGPERQCILTLVDEATRYLVVRILKSEKSTEFVKGVERAWVRHFGVPSYIRVDSAKGWESRAVRDWCSDHGVILEVAPAESHNWLGVVERRHQVVRRALELYMEDMGGASLASLKEAAIFVPPKINMMSFTRGFTPMQWVLGRTPVQELSLTAEFYNPGIDAMDEQTHFAMVQEKRYRAARAYLKADSDAKLRRAMNQKFYESKDRVLVGQRCWYWRIQGSGHLQKSKWRGPARCVAAEMNEDGTKPVVQWLVHGTSLLRCSPAHVRPLVEEARARPVVNPADALKDLEEIRARSTTQFRDLVQDPGVDEPMLEDLMEPSEDPPMMASGDEQDRQNMYDYEPSIAPEDEEPQEVPGVVSVLLPGLPLGQPLGPEGRERTPRRGGQDQPGVEAEAIPSPSQLPAGSAVSPQVVDDEETPESPSKKMCRSDEPEDDELMIEDVRFVEPINDGFPVGWIAREGELRLDEVWLAGQVQGGLRRNEANPRDMTVEQREMVVKAKQKELSSFFSNQVWEFASPNDAQKSHDRTITARWVLTWKTDPQGLPMAKARLVLRGFQDPDLLHLEKASPTAARLGKMVLLSLAALLNWRTFCGDVKAAFLSGAKFQREILVRLPKDCGPLLGVKEKGETFMRLLKSAYGLADAPLLWFKEATRRLQALHLKPQLLDKCTFAYYEKDELKGLLILHVDDMFLAGDMSSGFSNVVEKLKANFEFGKWEELTEKHNITYCGGVVSKEASGFSISFEKYLQKICPLTIPKGRDQQEKMSDHEKTRSRGLLGALQWPGGQGYPPLMASTSLLAGELSDGKVEVMVNLNKTLRLAKANTKSGLQFPKVGTQISDLALVCFCDAAFGVRKDFSSQGGYLLILTNKKILEGEKCRYTCLAWKSFKLPRVCRSSLSAESQAMASALEEMLMAKLFMKLLLEPQCSLQEAQKNLTMPSAIVTDCRALYDLVRKENVQSTVDKRVAVESLVIRDLMQQLQAKLRWVSSERQMADGLTKLASRQQMAEAMQSGYVQLIHDGSFTAAKKKSFEERESSRISMTSRIAASTVAMVAAESLKGSETVEDDGYFTVVIAVVVVAFGILIHYVIVMFQWCFERKSEERKTLTTEQSVQVDKMTGEIRKLESELGKRSYENGEIVHENRMLKLKIEELERQTSELHRQLDETTTRLTESEHRFVHGPWDYAEMAFPRPDSIWISRAGKRWHTSGICHHIQGREGVQRFQVCRDCP